MNFSPDERKKLPATLDALRQGVEELLLAGLTTASKSTVERLDVSFKEASRLRLLRLGSTLRIANEEISRFTSNSPQFSARRLAFFLGRAWLLATAITHALQSGDEAALDELCSTPPNQPVESLRAVVLGVTKRAVPGAFASFDFRLRALDAAGPVPAGEALVWSCVFPLRKDLDLPAEAFLHLPQKQKFKPAILLEKKIVQFQSVSLAKQPTSASRLVLQDASVVSVSDSYENWAEHWHWDVAAAADRVDRYRVTPLELEIEFQEEAFLEQWEADAVEPVDDETELLPVRSEALRLSAKLERRPAAAPLRDVMLKLAKGKKRPPLYGLVHYESCRMMFQPLTALGKDGPEYLTIAQEKVSQAALVKAMKFT